MTERLHGFFDIWQQTIEIMAMKELEKAPCNEGILFLPTGSPEK